MKPLARALEINGFARVEGDTWAPCIQHVRYGGFADSEYVQQVMEHNDYSEGHVLGYYGSLPKCLQEGKATITRTSFIFECRASMLDLPDHLKENLRDRGFLLVDAGGVTYFKYSIRNNANVREAFFAFSQCLSKYAITWGDRLDAHKRDELAAKRFNNNLKAIAAVLVLLCIMACIPFVFWGSP
jgi:hypothetical protein